MIDARKAAQIAQQYLRSVYPDKQFPNLQLEEVELTDDRKFWMITLSYVPPDAMVLVYPLPREYKIFKIRAEDGEVVSMKIRQIK
jgi:hypothetical protein